MILDSLELELRRLPDVAFVGYGDRAEVLVVHLVAHSQADGDSLRHEAERACRIHLDRAFVVEITGPSRPSRIRLVDVQQRATDEVEVRLALGTATTIGRAHGADPAAAAAATFRALQDLGAQVPFTVEAAALFEHVVGEGVMVVLGSEHAGPRYGVAGGKDVVQAAARATLHALNRYLSTQLLPARAAS